jgi:Domain of unknown function (DUF6484)
MSRAPSELMSQPKQVEDEHEVVATHYGLPSPLAEIAARSSLGTNGGSGTKRKAARKSASRTRRKARPATSSIDPRTISLGEVVVGTLAGLNDAGEPLIRHPLDPSGSVMRARTTVPLDPSRIDREVVLAFENGDVGKPIVLGVLQQREDRPTETAAPRPTTSRVPLEATIDGDQLVFSADREIVLRCGDASLTLTRAGKVLIRGTYLLSRSSGVNRIKGGSVQIN